MNAIRVNGEVLTASFLDTWTVVDESGQRFWPTKPAKTATAALFAARDGRGTWKA